MIELTDWMREELARRLRQEAPLEACGLISAPKNVPEGQTPTLSLWGAENVSEQPHTSFLIAPETQTAILTQLWKQGHELVGLYHSHPMGDPEPSERDRQIAARQPFPLTWVIVAQKPCVTCDGSGVTPASRPECCGNTVGGECRGDCVIEVPTLDPCPCGGEEPPATFWVGDLP